MVKIKNHFLKSLLKIKINILPHNIYLCKNKKNANIIKFLKNEKKKLSFPQKHEWKYGTTVAESYTPSQE